MGSLIAISEAASLALHTMAVLAVAGEQRWTNQGMADHLQGSSHHLAKVMQRLARAQLVESARGPQGGFRLARPPESIRLLEIYEAVEGPLSGGGCLLNEPLCEDGDCVLGEVVQKAHRQIREYLANTPLSDMASGISLKRQQGTITGLES